MTPVHDNLVLFDGVCNLCTKSVHFIIRHDKQATFRFVSVQSDLGREVFRASGLDPDDVQTIALVRRGRTLIRSDAAIEIATQFGGFWRLLVMFRILPRGLRDWLYEFVASRRYKWFGQRDRCMIPSADVRQRFLA
jgi:predicted DCC family thiol-disulfide oxidoreductase YuxK